MIELYILLGSLIFGTLLIFIKNRIEIYIDNRKFMKEVNLMIEKNRIKHNKAIEDALYKSLPLIIDYINKKKA